MQGQGRGARKRPSKTHANNIWEAEVWGGMGGNRFIRVKIHNEIFFKNIFTWIQPRQFEKRHNNFLI